MKTSRGISDSKKENIVGVIYECSYEYLRNSINVLNLPTQLGIEKNEPTFNALIFSDKYFYPSNSRIYYLQMEENNKLQNYNITLWVKNYKFYVYTKVNEKYIYGIDDANISYIKDNPFKVHNLTMGHRVSDNISGKLFKIKNYMIPLLYKKRNKSRRCVWMYTCLLIEYGFEDPVASKHMRELQMTDKNKVY